MGNIATGIGLSGKLEVDNSGQLNRLAAERDAAQAREQEKARKDKERDDLEKQIAGNAVWSETMQLSRNQQTAKDVLTKRMANIFEAYQSGEGNTAITALTELNKAKQEIESLKKFDDQQFKAFKTALEKPDEYQDFNRPVLIKGKEYKNALEAFNDTSLNPEDIANAYGGSEHVVVDDPYLGGKVYLPNPQPTINPIGAIREFEDGEFSEQITGTPFKDPKLGDESYVPVSRKLNQQSIWSEIRRLGSDAGVIHYYEAQMKREMGDKGGSLKRDDAFFNEVQERIERDVYTRLNSMSKDDGRMLFTPRPLAAEKESASAKNAAATAGLGAYDSTGKTWIAPVPSQDTKKTQITLPAGTFAEAEGVPKYKIPKAALIEATPVHFEWTGDPGTSYFVYQSELDPKGQGNSKYKKTYTYRVPLSRTTASNYASAQDTKWSDLAPALFEGIKAGQIGDAEKWIKSLGIDASIPPSGSTPPKAAAAKSAAKTGIPLINNKAEFDALPKGAEYTKADGKTYKKA